MAPSARVKRLNILTILEHLQYHQLLSFKRRHFCLNEKKAGIHPLPKHI